MDGKYLTSHLVKSVVFIAMATLSLGAQAGFISLNDFFADPSVTVSADGSTATLAEDPAASAVLLSNDPGLGDPNVIIPASGATLTLDFVFSEGAGNDDAFAVSLFDANTLATLDSFFTQDSASSTLSFDLSTFVGQVLGLQFELRSFDNLLDSSVSISNLDLTTVSVPAPPIVALVLLSLLLAGWSRKRRT